MGALEEYRAAYTLNPTNATYRGNYERLSQLNPDDDNVHYNRGVALQQKGDVDGAIAEYREALRSNPNNEEAHAGLGLALGQKHDWDGAISEFALRCA